MTTSEISIAPEVFTPTGLNLRDNLTAAEWAEIHRNVLLCKTASSAWLKQSRKFGEDRFGVDYVADVEVQAEFDMGFAPSETPKRINLNPADKSRTMVTIEGIAQSYAMWHRKMSAEIPRWDRPKIEKALRLLEPIEAQYRELRARLNNTGGEGG